MSNHVSISVKSLFSIFSLVAEFLVELVFVLGVVSLEVKEPVFELDALFHAMF